MTEYLLRPTLPLAGALTATWVWRIRPLRRGGAGKPPVRHRPQLLSLLLIAYLAVGLACMLAHRLG
jgi:hypothetical protein